MQQQSLMSFCLQGKATLLPPKKSPPEKSQSIKGALINAMYCIPKNDVTVEFVQRLKRELTMIPQDSGFGQPSPSFEAFEDGRLHQGSAILRHFALWMDRKCGTHGRLVNGPRFQRGAKSIQVEATDTVLKQSVFLTAEFWSCPAATEKLCVRCIWRTPSAGVVGVGAQELSCGPVAKRANTFLPNATVGRSSKTRSTETPILWWPWFNLSTRNDAGHPVSFRNGHHRRASQARRFSAVR